MEEKIISQRTLPPQLWKQRKNSKHSHKTSCYWLNIIAKLHTSHGKFHYEWNSRELLPRRHLGHLCKKLHNSLRKLLGFSCWGCIRVAPWGDCTMDENPDSYREGICEIGQLAQWMKTWELPQKWHARNLHNGWKPGWKCMKPHCLSTLDLPLPIHPFSNFLIISKCFYTSLNLAFEEDGFQRKKVQTNKMKISVLMLGEIFLCQCLLNWANAIFIPSLLWPAFYPYHQCNI